MPELRVPQILRDALMDEAASASVATVKALCADIDTLLSHITTLESQLAWQPIEQLKAVDGMRILAYCPNKYDPKEVVLIRVDGYWGLADNPDEFWGYQPTHYTLLQPPPEVTR